MTRPVLLAALALAVSASFAEPLRLEIPAPGERSVRKIDPRGAAKTELAFSFPIADMQQAWFPSYKRPMTERKWWLRSASAPQCDFPWFSFFNLAGTNGFSFGASSLRCDNAISAKINQEKGVYDVVLTVASDRPLVPFEVTLDRRAVKWTDALADWRGSLGYAKGRYPDAAWRPSYCSWYAAHAAIDADWTERQAALAAELGFGTFILDDGWSYDDRKRVNPVSIVDWYRDTGRWDSFSKAKFPDFRAHRERMRKLGLRYIVWVSPYFVGTRSPVYAKFRERFAGQQPVEGNYLASPDDREILDAVTAQFETLLRDCDLDGLKIDFLDYILPDTEKPRGELSLDFVEGLMKRLRAIKPDGLYEFRQSYATPVTAALATQFRAGDVPFEWLANLMRIAQIRLAMGDGVPIHSDPIYWSDTETDANLERHFMAAMAGVPMLSMDLEKLSPERRALVKKWLDFYREKVERFQRSGHWEVEYRNGSLSWVTSELGNDILVIQVDPLATPALEPVVGSRRAIWLKLF